MSRPRSIHPRSLRPRAGAVLVQSLVMLTALVAITSLGADYGRVQLAKFELQRCADAAARAAASRTPGDISGARDLAVSYGQFNQADGTPVTIDRNNDVQFGIWNESNRTFEAVTGSNVSSANAVRVTARRTGGNGVPLLFAALLGKSKCDVEAASIARVPTQSTSAGFVALEKVQAGNNFYGASYNSNVGPPGGSNVSSGFKIGSNGALQFGNNAEVFGDVTPGPSGSISHGVHWYVTGSQAKQGSAYSFPATESAGVSSSGALSRGNNATVTLSGGTYLYSSITFGNNGRLVTTGPVTIYVSGATQLGNDFDFVPHNNNPSNLRIRVIGSNSVQAGNNTSGGFELYGPASVVQIGNNAILGGQIIARELQIGTNAQLYRDTGATGGGGSSGGITTVQ